jgi:catechol 2,3-dioxygenase-like lactoylglutathione lyase family enzyme
LKLGNVIYKVTELDRAVAFYRDVLGLKLKFRDGDHWAAFDVGGTTLALEPASHGAAAPGLRASLKLAADLPKFVQRVRSLGVSVTDPRIGPHEQTALLTDPDGNEITLYVTLPVPSA